MSSKVAPNVYKVTTITRFCFIYLLALNKANTHAPALVQRPANTEPKLIIPCKYKFVKRTEKIQLGINPIRVSINGCPQYYQVRVVKVRPLQLDQLSN